jgi:Pectate lyase superfamily protein
MAVIRPNATPAATNVAAGDIFLIDGATGVRALAASSVLKGSTFDNRADITATAIPAVVISILVKSYAVGSPVAPPATYVRGTSGSALAVQDGLGAYWGIAGSIVYAEWFGAKGDGVTDDAPAIRAAATYVASLVQGGKVMFLASIYLLGSRDPLGNGLAILHPYSNVTYEGCGESSVLKVANGMNTVSTQFAVIYPPDETNTYTYNNVHFRNFKIDFNGVNNGGFNYQNVGICVRWGSNISVDNVVFANSPGSQCISFGTNSAVSVANITVTNCKFFSHGDIINASCTDHSSIYIVASDYSITGCILKQASQSSKSTGIELHGFNGSAQGNSIDFYAKGTNIAALSHTATNLTFTGNTIFNSLYGVTLWNDGTSSMKGVVIDGNTFYQSVQTAGIPYFDFNSGVTADGIFGVTFANNTFYSAVAAGSATATPTLYLGRGQNVLISGNTFSGGLGPAIGNGTFSGTTSIKIVNNNIIDAGQTSTAASKRGILINSGTTIDSFIMSGNRIENVASAYMTTGFDVTLNATYGFFTPDNVVSNIATQQNLSVGGGWNTAPFNGVMYSQGLGLVPTATSAAANSVLVTNGSNVPSLSTTLPTGLAMQTPASLVGTNITGTASGLTAGNVTTNANLTGPITSTGNATAVASQTGTGSKFVMDTSPTFAGVPAAPTAAVDTNTTQIATTAMVLAQASSTNPLMDGAAAVGASTRFARQDHVHPTDTTRVSNAGDTITGTLNLSSTGVSLNASGQVKIASAYGVPAGGNAAVSMLFSAGNVGFYVGSGAPTVSAAKGSIYLRTDGSSTSTRLYTNTDGATGWTSVTTAT